MLFKYRKNKNVALQPVDSTIVSSGLKRKMPTGSVETSQVGVEKKIRLTNEVVDDTIATSDVVNDVTSVISTSIIGDDSFLVKQEREQDLYLDSNRIVTKSCSSNAVGSLSHTAFETLSPVGLPRVKVLKEIEDPSESGENSPFTSGLTPEECSDPSGGAFVVCQSLFEVDEGLNVTEMAPTFDPPNKFVRTKMRLK